MMFDLTIPPSLAELPGRVVTLAWDEDDRPVKALPKPKKSREVLNAEERARYARNAARISAQRKARYAQWTPEQKEAHREKNRRWRAANWVRLQLRKGRV